MNDARETVGTVAILWQNDNGQCCPDIEDVPLIDRAMRLWAESRRDTWLSIRLATGAEFSVLASTITSLSVTTAEQRADATMRDKALEDEKADNRRAAGYIDTE